MNLLNRCENGPNLSQTSCLHFEKSVFPYAVSCTNQKHRCLYHVSPHWLPNLSESQFPYSKAGSIIGVLILNDMRSIKYLAQYPPHSWCFLQGSAFIIRNLPLHILSAGPPGPTGKTFIARTLLNSQVSSSADGKMPHSPEVGILVGGKGN